MLRFRPWAQPGFLVPLLLGGTLAADLALRLLPRDWVSYRAWEAVRTFATPPFEARARYRQERTYGNLAALGNLPSLRQYRSVTFTTDAFGYHNPPQLADTTRIAALLLGDSFAAGAEVNDDETFAVQLGRRTGRSVYNAAPGNPAPAYVRDLARQVRMRDGLVIFEYYEGTGLPGLELQPFDTRAARCGKVLGAWNLPVPCRVVTWTMEQFPVSPLQVFARRAYRRLQNDRLLPNPGRDRVVPAALADGSVMLFSAEARAQLRSSRPVAAACRFISWAAGRLATQRLRMLVVLVPDKYAVYAPLLRSPDWEPVDSQTYLARLEGRLRTAGVPVVNLAAPLRAAARAALAEGALIYWKDDTHWNAAGIDVAATVVAPELKRLSSPGEPAPAARPRPGCGRD